MTLWPWPMCPQSTPRSRSALTPQWAVGGLLRTRIPVGAPGAQDKRDQLPICGVNGEGSGILLEVEAVLPLSWCHLPSTHWCVRSSSTPT